jgi:uncharacterized protein YhbP (UPF0306 family)
VTGTDLAARGEYLLAHGRFMTLATTNGTTPWAATVNYVPLRAPLRLLWYSMREARHSRDLALHPQAAGSIFLTGLPGFGLDGAQFDGPVHTVEGAQAEEFHRHYYELNFPDVTVRREWELPVEQFRDAGPRRFYYLAVSNWWLLDIDQWLIDKRDQKITAPTPD